MPWRSQSFRNSCSDDYPLVGKSSTGRSLQPTLLQWQRRRSPLQQLPPPSTAATSSDAKDKDETGAQKTVEQKIVELTSQVTSLTKQVASRGRGRGKGDKGKGGGKGKSKDKDKGKGKTKGKDKDGSIDVGKGKKRNRGRKNRGKGDEDRW